MTIAKNLLSRRDWLTGVSSTMAAAGIHACGQSPSVPARPSESKLPFAGEPTPDRPNIVVFLADTLRADHLSCYGNPTKASPFLDELARRGVLFENNISGSTWTKPSLGTMLTGVPARVHQAVASSPWRGVADLSSYRVQTLRSAFETLPQALKSVGYTTAYIQTNAHGRPEFGYGRGFDFVRYLPHYPAAMQVTDASKWISQEAKQPFFLFIHEIDPHGPYDSDLGSFVELHGTTPNNVLANLDPDEAERVRRYTNRIGPPAKTRKALQGVSPEAVRFIEMNYDAEIYEVDRQIKRFAGFLDRIEIMDHTVFTFISDHGEGFGEHGFYAHKESLAYDELVHVPLIMSGGGLPKNIRVPHTTTTLDFYPTLLELARAPIPSYVPGSPMFSADRGLLITEDRLAYIDLDKQSADLSDWDAAIVKNGYKVASHQKGTEHWIFDRDLDPGERDNLAGAGKLSADVEQGLVASLQSEVKRYEQLSLDFGEPEWLEGDDSVEEELEALGYV